MISSDVDASGQSSDSGGGLWQLLSRHRRSLAVTLRRCDLSCRVLLRVRMLYYLRQEVIGDQADRILDGSDCRWVQTPPTPQRSLQFRLFKARFGGPKQRI